MSKFKSLLSFIDTQIAQHSDRIETLQGKIQAAIEEVNELNAKLEAAKVELAEYQTAKEIMEGSLGDSENI